ncbi:gluconate 2-dehydrogenase subunit 3 family protein [Galbibacter sp. BG1]|uniref:gluconate 2-dehydrogenase subunit 3 family protein n=1 Tax=Galbibacter sp. BG1 TaxID=1170699 RepID=UPI0015C10315|nr:gluconate 2-dehydrogenase subunit 3 family protein [Galbibacter sp. BG1]QLE01886.1 gluconate 2-dehydrogenase subunit 3 family protein [Galbibacter sp. BG1]
MERRKALKNIGLSFGYVAATPTLFSILQSCKNEPDLDWQPSFFTEAQASMVNTITDLILPKTDNLPGAKDLNIPMFIDLSFKELLTEEEKKNIKKGAEETVVKLDNDFSEKSCDSLLASYLNAPADIQQKYLTNIRQNNFDADALIYNFLIKVRANTVWAFKESEFIGEQVQVYEPVPGPFHGCIDWDKKIGYSLS